MSRSEAQRRIKLRDYQRAMKDVVSTSVCKETIDEAPQAYKDMDLIISALGPTVDIVDHLPSLVNLKGTD
jgi:tRNA-splicing ligase RtcB